ncbi:hypothetical protein RB593_003815 [Gaeumannomyces tritici]
MASNAPTEVVINNNPALQSYYHTYESRIGYRLLLGGTRHFGYYASGSSFPFPIGRALRAMEEKMAEALALPSGSQLLDAGCGVGHVALYLARNKGMRVTAIDVVEHHVTKARRNIARAALPEGQVTAQRMDYHHLETLADESHDGVYTMETLVHATDPEAVLAGFLRVLRPGGRVALFEYDHDVESMGEGQLGYLANDLRTINELAAMPTCMRSKQGLFEDMLHNAGFEDVQVHDYSQNVRPMLRLFYWLAVIPAIFVRLLGLQRYFINTVAGAGGFLGQEYWRYVAITATKPGASVEGAKTK